ncbi:putative MFS transporter [Talaromyces proteolyticus]|uniref:MFS transporter n=1 Tax=Talaromyces proteolyticus TaxID=1131652 RepID=A0AAD4KLS0_9EURO|nr:putative MFS transporter [Talaromyces proteolyticus]KAH8694935.1 putative MFS transporter [Talaromyces proteolyticus]
MADESQSKNESGGDIEKGLAALETTPTNHSIVNNNGSNNTPMAGLDHIRSHVSHQEMHASNNAYREENAEQYLRFSPSRKTIIVAILAFCSFLSPVSSTSILPAVPEVADTFNTSGSMINASNAVFMVFMGLSATFWGTFSQILGRRPMSVWSSFFFFVFSLATALSPNLSAYFIFRALTAFQGTSFLVVGSASISDIYTPTERATALAWFLSGTLIGPALGPFLGGVIVTYRSWRVIFWLQSALAGTAFVLVAFFIPETIPHKTIEDLSDLSPLQKTRAIWKRMNPIRVIVLLFEYPNLFFAAVTAAALVWNQYSLLTPIRYVLNPRFNLTTPIESGLFYLAPGCGYLFGTLFGGRYADYIVRKWIRKRDGVRVPEDRLKSCLVFVGIVIPAFILIYGWTVEKAVGGIPVPVISMFLQGVAQLFCFPSLNTYCLDVMQSKGKSAEVVAGNYMFRYAFAALGTGVVLPAVETMGVGWFSVITASFLLVSGVLMWLTTVFGARWRQGVDEKRSRKKAEA